jgi:hypothetical protein
VLEGPPAPPSPVPEVNEGDEDNASMRTAGGAAPTTDGFSSAAALGGGSLSAGEAAVQHSMGSGSVILTANRRDCSLPAAALEAAVSAHARAVSIRSTPWWAVSRLTAVSGWLAARQVGEAHFGGL